MGIQVGREEEERDPGKWVEDVEKTCTHLGHRPPCIAGPAGLAVMPL